MSAPHSALLDRHLAGEIRSMLEERLWRGGHVGLTVEALRNDEALATSPASHPALFSDHGIVHVRDVASGIVDLAATTNGVLLPARADDRQEFVVALGVLMTYIHDAGMHDSTQEGRRIHALYAADIPFSGSIDAVLDLLLRGDGPITRRIAAVNGTAPFAVPPDVVVREILSLAAAHSRKAVPSAILGDPCALRTLMQIIVFTDLAQHRSSTALPTADDPLPETLGPSSRWYSAPRQHAFAWLESPDPAHRAFAEDTIDAARLVRAADALRQRGTTFRTTAGYEIFIDGNTGAAVFALRATDGDRLAFLRVESPLSAGEANLRGAWVTPSGDLRVAFHRGRFNSPAAGAAACAATARVVADVADDVLGAFALRAQESDLPDPRQDPAAMQVELERPRDDPSFADDVAARVARLDPSIGTRTTVIDEPRGRAPEEPVVRERARFAAGVPLGGGDSEAISILSALGAVGLKVGPIDPNRAFEGARRVRLHAGDVLVEAGSPPTFVYVPLGAGLVVEPLGGYGAAAVPAWVPIGVTGVVRGAERNSTVGAVEPVDLLAVPGELFLAEWFFPYEVTELPDVFAKLSPG